MNADEYLRVQLRPDRRAQATGTQGAELGPPMTVGRYNEAGDWLTSTYDRWDQAGAAIHDLLVKQQSPFLWDPAHSEWRPLLRQAGTSSSAPKPSGDSGGGLLDAVRGYLKDV